MITLWSDRKQILGQNRMAQITQHSWAQAVSTESSKRPRWFLYIKHKSKTCCTNANQLTLDKCNSTSAAQSTCLNSPTPSTHSQLAQYNNAICFDTVFAIFFVLSVLLHSPKNRSFLRDVIIFQNRKLKSHQRLIKVTYCWLHIPARSTQGITSVRNAAKVYFISTTYNAKLF